MVDHTQSVDKFYGPHACQPDMDPETFKAAAERVLESLQMTPERRKEVEELTRKQADSNLLVHGVMEENQSL